MLNLPAEAALKAQSPGGFEFLIPMVAIFAIFYFLLIRPQTKRQREHDAMQKSLQKGDVVVTTGGLHGQVTGVTDDVLTLEIAATKTDRIRVKCDRARVERRVAQGKGEQEE